MIERKEEVKATDNASIQKPETTHSEDNIAPSGNIKSLKDLLPVSSENHQIQPKIQNSDSEILKWEAEHDEPKAKIQVTKKIVFEGYDKTFVPVHKTYTCDICK